MRTYSPNSGRREVSHWMWFIFPQIRGSGAVPSRSSTRSPPETKPMAYLQHPLLGSALNECTRLVLLVKGLGLRDLRPPDDMKLIIHDPLCPGLER